MQKERNDQDHIQAPLYIEANPDEIPEHSRDHDDQISTLYAIDEYELGVEGEEYEYAKTDAIYDENEIDEYWKQFSDFMQAKLHKKYDLRSRKRSRRQEDEGEQQVPALLQKAAPQEPQPAKQLNKGKQQQNTSSKTQMLQGESSQDKSEKIPLEKLVSIPQEISVMKRGED